MDIKAAVVVFILLDEHDINPSPQTNFEPVLGLVDAEMYSATVSLSDLPLPRTEYRKYFRSRNSYISYIIIIIIISHWSFVN